MSKSKSNFKKNGVEPDNSGSDSDDLFNSKTKAKPSASSKFPRKENLVDSKEKRTQLNEQMNKINEKITYHQDQLEMLKAKKTLLDGKIRKL